MQPTVSEFLYTIQSAGCVVFKDIVSSDLLARIRIDLPRREEECRRWQQANNLATTPGTAHHIVGGADSLTEFLECLFLDEFISAYFDGPYILNSYGSFTNEARANESYPYAHRFHRDVRTFSPGFRLMLNMLVMVDEFTIDNGATKVVPGSHRIELRPDDEFMERSCTRLVGGAGSIVLFDSNLWHSAAVNNTGQPRTALTATFSRPFIKQQMDYPRMLGDAYQRNEKMRQLLGYNARVPSSYAEWYQPPEKRMYRSGQG